MINLGLLLVGYILGVFSIALLGALIVLHRPRYEAPTLYRRKNRDRREVEAAPAEEKSEDRVRYQFMGATGLEE